MSKVTKSRPSPSQSAQDYDVGTIKKGTDGNKWIIRQTESKINRWVKLLGKVKTYTTWDNGGEPFRVIISDKLIAVYEICITDLNKKGEHDHCKISRHYKNMVMTITKFKHVWIGRSLPTQTPYKKPFTGNSILIQMNPLQYIYIGDRIYRFMTKEPIIKYVSNMGNSGVPYPYALTKSYAYLMIENIYIDHDDETEPYEIYYNHDKSHGNVKSYKISGLKILVKRSDYTDC